jgi:outer membrane protein OmpA-like peptidoglycan-associated protein
MIRHFLPSIGRNWPQRRHRAAVKWIPHIPVLMEDPDMNTRKTMITTLALAVLLSAPAMAEPAAGARASKSETVGLGSGLLVGALAGGPVGALLGAAAGAMLGDRMHRDAEAISGLEEGLFSEQARTRGMNATLATLRQELSARDRMLADASDTTSRIGDSLEFSMLFRTNDASLSPAAVQRLERLGSVLADLGDIEVRIEGHADPRGAEPLNEALSEARAQAVKAVLLNAGLSRTQVLAIGHGARYSQATEGDIDGYAMDRRVDIRMTLDADGRRLAQRD